MEGIIGTNLLTCMQLDRSVRRHAAEVRKLIRAGQEHGTETHMLHILLDEWRMQEKKCRGTTVGRGTYDQLSNEIEDAWYHARGVPAP